MTGFSSRTSRSGPLAIVLLTLLGLAATAAAQPHDRRGPGDRRGDRSQDRRDAIKKKVHVLRAATLSEELKLDDKTLARILPVFVKWDDVIEGLLRQRLELQRRLDGATSIKDPRLIERLIDEAVANQKAFWELEAKRLSELRKILSPAQTARLLIVLPAFERKLQSQLRRAINRRGMPAAEDDDDTPDPGPPRRR